MQLCRNLYESVAGWRLVITSMLKSMWRTKIEPNLCAHLCHYWCLKNSSCMISNTVTISFLVSPLVQFSVMHVSIIRCPDAQWAHHLQRMRYSLHVQLVAEFETTDNSCCDQQGTRPGHSQPKYTCLGQARWDKSFFKLFCAFRWAASCKVLVHWQRVPNPAGA